MFLFMGILLNAWMVFETTRHGKGGLPAAALAPIVVVAVAFVMFCLVDLARATDVRYLPRWLWAIICVISVPLGGIAYLILGRRR
jgi:hypothetical protein